MDFKGHEPDIIFHLPNTALDETAIKEWWGRFKSTHRFNALNCNCSTVVYKALRAGGALKYAKKPGNLIWHPGAVANLARKVKNGCRGKELEFGVELGVDALTLYGGTDEISDAPSDFKDMANSIITSGYSTA